MKQTDYAYSVSYIRAIENKLLTTAETDSLISASSFSDAARILLDKGYSDKEIRPENLDDVLKKQLENCWHEVMWTLSEENILEIFIYKNDFHNLKAVLKAIASGNKNFDRLIISPNTVDYRIFISAIANNDFSALPVMLRAAAQRAHEVLDRTGDGQMSDAVIDKACMDFMSGLADSTGNTFLAGFIRLQNTMTDMKIAQRSAKTAKDRTFLESSLSEKSDIDRSGLIKAAVSDSVVDFLKERGFNQAADAMSAGFSEFEKYSDNKITEYVKSAKYVTLGIEPLIAYIHRKQIEIQTVRVILSAKLNNIDEKLLRSKIREV